MSFGRRRGRHETPRSAIACGVLKPAAVQLSTSGTAGSPESGKRFPMYGNDVVRS